MSSEFSETLLPDNEDAKNWTAKLQSPELAPYWLAAIIESADDAIISKTLDGIITSWNKGAERIFGYTAAEIIGKPVMILIPPDHTDEEPGILAQLKKGNRIEHYETVRVRKDGTLINVSLTVSPIKMADGSMIGASKIARDITEWKQNEARLHEALRQAQEASRLKDEFLATISHELRTPLTSILGWMSLMRSGSLNEEAQRKALEIIERNGRAQNQLIEDLLDVSRIITGKLRLEVQAVDLQTVINAAVETARPAAEAKEIKLQVLLDSQASLISGDPDRLQQVVWNLLSNAVKFTPKGGRVQIRLERVNSHVEIVVSDTGEGIEPEFLPFVFNRFSQADQSMTRKYGGLGLGLAIVKQLVELHGGTVYVESKGERQGTTFIVKLPLLPLRAMTLDESSERVHPTARTETKIDCPPELTGLRVLVVDDEPDARDLLNVVLTNCGAEVFTADSATEALEKIKTERPDVLVSDIGMPETDGYLLIRRIRALPTTHGGGIPAVALTAYARAQDRIRALRAGYQIHVPKPIEPGELIAVIASLARRNNI